MPGCIWRKKSRLFINDSSNNARSTKEVGRGRVPMTKDDARKKHRMASILDSISPISDIRLFIPISDHFNIGLNFDNGYWQWWLVGKLFL
jgi:hypothetical protein